MKGQTVMPETSRRGLLFGTAAVSAGALLTACTSNEPKKTESAANSAPADDKPGKAVTIGFAGPQADHGWLNAINVNAKSRAETYSDVTLEITEGSNDTAAQIGQVKTLINKKVDVLVVLPADGKALTQVGLEAMRAGIPVVNLDRIFASPQAYRCWVGGDNYGMGLNAGHYIGEQLKDKANAKVVELAGIDNLELTKQRSQGFADALKNYSNIKLVARQAADFTVESGQAKMAQLLQAQKQFDALWNHDDDQASARSAPSSRRAATSSSWSAAPEPSPRWTPSRPHGLGDQGDRPLPADDGRVRDRPGPGAGPGQGCRRPLRDGDPDLPDPVLRGRDEGQHRPVPADGLQLTGTPGCSERIPRPVTAHRRGGSPHGP